jgi:imidazolonepropionase-like amidohydrolase
MDLLFKNAHLIDCIGDEIRAGIDVLVREDKIAEIGTDLKAAAADCKEIDLNGAFLLPGLINCHVHLIWDGDRADPEALIAFEPDELVALRAFREARRHLYLGITTVCDTGSQNATVTSLRDAVAAGVLEGPNIVASGPPLGMTGGHVSRIIRPADGCDEVRKTVRNLIKWEKVDFIKVMATGGCYEHGEEPGSPQLTVEEMRVAVEEAHNRGKTVAAHAEGLVGIRNTLKAGIDVIEHGNFADEEAIEQMVKQGTYLCPTIVCFVRMCGPQAKASGVPDYAVRKGKMVADAQAISFPKAVAAGVQIITGTEIGRAHV